MANNPMCQICGEFPETTEHSLILCPWALAVWFGSSTGYIPEKQKITTLEAWILEIQKKSSLLSDNSEYVMQCVFFHLWGIWKHRCDVVMRHGTPNPRTAIECINRSLGEWLNASGLLDRTSPPETIPSPIPTWQPPIFPSVKVNVDGAWDNVTHKSGIGVIVRNHRGNSIAGASILGNHNSPIEVEADAVVKGLQLAAFLKIQNIIIEGDCQELFHALNNPSSSPNWRISHMLSKVFHLKTLFTGIKFHWVPREANRVADAAAKLAKRRLCSQDWANRPPTSLISILRSDGLPGPPVV
ncbi:uncharacterized protein LOC133745063 [Rosa rugosa]|uniref:uncharacterized protein LOC133745063 n=1 Tax=Rosa rugosa TaxID=74645 RepID=UPI002B415834|nr:uncharacterized protein LOC133745063 [Rosa rugosa]